MLTDKEGSDGKSKNGGIMARIGKEFRSEILDIKKIWKKNGRKVDKAGIAKITNLITHHNLWNTIKNDIITAKEEEVQKYG